MNVSHKYLDNIYKCYNKRDYVDPDPLMFLYRYSKKQDIEIIGLLSASLAFGSVKQINIFLNKLFKILGTSPSSFLTKSTDQEILSSVKGLKYRFVNDIDIYNFLISSKKVLNEFGDFESLFLNFYDKNEKSDKSLKSALIGFRNYFETSGSTGYLLSDPSKGGACKRWFLFLRWMIRNDQVDLGIWPEKLIPYLLYPLDTHISRIAGVFNMTSRKSNDYKKACEITAAFSRLNPNDPVKYDFAMTRLGIRRFIENPCDTCTNHECFEFCKSIYLKK